MVTANDRQVGGEHYKGAEYQHWDWVTDIKLPYLPGVGSKYVFRWRRSGKGIQDLEKAVHYMEKCIERNVRGSIELTRHSKFWALVTSNDHLSMTDAAVMWYMMEGEWALARAGVLVLLEQWQALQSGAS